MESTDGLGLARSTLGLAEMLAKYDFSSPGRKERIASLLDETLSNIKEFRSAK